MKARKIAAAALIAGGVPLVAAPTWAHAGGDKVTLCHRTDADNNPYVEITVDPDAVFKQGHDGHDGPVWNPSLKSQHTKWGDIIPPFDYTVKHGNQESTGHYPGKNWDSEGQAIQGDGCQVEQPASPSPTPTESKSSTPTPTSTQSTSSSPTPSRSATQSATPTASETSSPTPTGSATSTSTSSPTSSPSTTVLPTSSTKPPETPTEVPTTPPAPSPGPTVSPKPQPLPHTGADTLPLMALGVGMTGAGAMLARVRRR